MKILMVSSLYPPIVQGGAEKSSCELAESLARAGHQVSVFTLCPGADPIKEEINGVVVYRVPLDNTYWPFNLATKKPFLQRLGWHLRDIWNRGAARRFAAVMDEVKPDLVHTNVLTGFTVSIWREVKKRHVGLVHTLRDYSLVCRRSSLFRRGQNCEKRCADCRCLTSISSQAAPLVDHIVGISQHVVSTHQSNGLFRQTPSSVIANIVRTSAGTASPGKAEKPGIVFGYLARIEPEKGIEVLLKAATSLADQNWTLLIGGRGADDYQAHLRSLYPDPRIKWVGFTAPDQFYSQIDVFVFPSLWGEPLGRTVIEAYFFGCSAICASAGGIPEAARLGKQVEFYPSSDAKALARLMKSAIDDPVTWKNGGFIDEAAMSAVSETTIVGQYEAIYETVRDAG